MNKDKKQLPEKGMHAIIQDATSQREYRIEGMGNGRYKVHVKLKPSSAK